MEEPGTSPRQSSPADYFAAERTFLAWIRTGLALMGFGFVVARFGLFLHEFHLAESRAPMRSYGLSLWFGTALIPPVCRRTPRRDGFDCQDDSISDRASFVIHACFHG